MRGRIKKALSGFYYVDTGEEVVTCRARGRFRKEGVSPLVGDRVEITVSGTEGMVDAIEPRRNVFSRPAVANIDQLVIVASNAIPQTDPYLIDRMTAIAALKGCEVLICINKSDLDHADELCAIYEKAGLPFLLTSAETGEGIAELREHISGKLSAFTGNSGVGKSSLLNALDPRFSVQVGEVSQALGRGRHTTRHVELYTLSGGAEIIDTPGFSSFDTDELGLALKERLPETLFGFRALSGRLPLRWLQPHEGKGLRRSGGCAGGEALRLAARELSAALQRAQGPAGVEQQMKKRKRREIPPLFPCPRGTGQRRAVYTVASGVTGRRCGHVGQELVLSGHLRAGAGTGDLHRCHFSGGLSDVSGRVASRRLRLGLYPEEVSGFEDRGVEVAQGPVRRAAAAVRDQRRAGIKRSFGA